MKWSPSELIREHWEFGVVGIMALGIASSALFARGCERGRATSDDEAAVADDNTEERRGRRRKGGKDRQRLLEAARRASLEAAGTAQAKASDEPAPAPEAAPDDASDVTLEERARLVRQVTLEQELTAALRSRSARLARERLTTLESEFGNDADQALIAYRIALGCLSLELHELEQARKEARLLLTRKRKNSLAPLVEELCLRPAVATPNQPAQSPPEPKSGQGR